MNVVIRQNSNTTLSWQKGGWEMHLAVCVGQSDENEELLLVLNLGVMQ